ncbi:RsmB/NOP family class I SAM-dependent RNA methyltransferase [Oceaniglobus indicus]|uniref:RsmB/NOP family class I SAM-dependent RNA methyltransferase n=1 Tax=Oceaniglobus indicus TaxID=2047749 RepID=UPI000C1A437F|nr:transcription antitermination factor NusB [Oceaniglobus indicus]
MATSPDPSRRAALSLLADVLENNTPLGDAALRLPSKLDGPARARAQRLAAGTLRWMDRSDRALGPFLRNKPHLRVLNALRLALFEIYVEGTADHGAVNDAVSLVREGGDTASQAGLTNAVLRNILRQGPEAWAALPVPRLAKWLRKRLTADHGKPAVAAMEAVFATVPPLDLSAKSDPAAVAQAVGGTVLATGSVRLAGAGQVSALPGYDTGDWWVQDGAAAVAGRLLAARPGERVIDLCAAPGGKTLQLAATGAEVTALDQSVKRLERVRENLARCGLTADVIAADALRWRPDTPFDAALVDAPCSATGTVRRHPELPRIKDGSGLDELIALQAAILDAALEMVKPGGRVVFCTCSLLRAEGEDQLLAALGRHPGLTVDRAALESPGIDPAWITPEGGLRLRPDYWADLGGMDGFFIAALTKPA